MLGMLIALQLDLNDARKPSRPPPIGFSSIISAQGRSMVTGRLSMREIAAESATAGGGGLVVCVMVSWQSEWRGDDCFTFATVATASGA